MERTFTKELKKQLGRCIKGTISIHVINNTLIIDIVTGVFQYWRYNLDNLSVILSAGLSVEIVADEIVNQYKKHILNQYFR